MKNKNNNKKNKMTNVDARRAAWQALMADLWRWARPVLLLAVLAGIVQSLRLRMPPVAVVLAVVGLIAWIILKVLELKAREAYTRSAPLPPHLKAAVQARYPQLGCEALNDVERGLRQFFMAHLRSGGRFVAMPSRVVDALWHEFILDTRAYRSFCQRAFGRFLDHSPAQTLGQDARRNDGLRRTWYWSCREEGIDPRLPMTLPLLFALDAELRIPDGFRYVPDCRLIGESAASGVHCGTSFGDGSASGDASGMGGCDSSDGGSGDGGGDGGGCGGGGD